ncbi:hypothetical protein [Nonomuraea sp. NPDC048916]|uniref:hypothetical protein n=1 Tax=Nonomuraea sp. NPDC048916 TaxID=3154232 RepID=UPI0033F01A45
MTIVANTLGRSRTLQDFRRRSQGLFALMEIMVKWLRIEVVMTLAFASSGTVRVSILERQVENLLTAAG